MLCGWWSWRKWNLVIESTQWNEIKTKKKMYNELSQRIDTFSVSNSFRRTRFVPGERQWNGAGNFQFMRKNTLLSSFAEQFDSRLERDTEPESCLCELKMKMSTFLVFLWMCKEDWIDCEKNLCVPLNDDEKERRDLTYHMDERHEASLKQHNLCHLFPHTILLFLRFSSLVSVLLVHHLHLHLHRAVLLVKSVWTKKKNISNRLPSSEIVSHLTEKREKTLYED